MKAKKLVRVMGIAALTVSILTGCSVTKGGKGTSVADYPNKPIHVIVPMAAGGPSDLTARAMEKLSSKYLGQALVIENKTGAGGALGYNEIVNATPDGYTLGLAATNMLLQPLYGSTEYTYSEEFYPVAQAVSNPIAVAVLADSPINTLEELIEHAKTNPGKLKYAYTNVGSLPHVVSAMFISQTDTLMEPVPFQGGADSMTAFLGNNVQVSFTQISELKAHAANGTVKILAIATEERLTGFPELPTFKEQGLDIVSSTWFGIVAPKNVPEEIKAKVAGAFNQIIMDPEFVKTAEDLGYIVDYLSPEDLAEKWATEQQAYKDIIEQSGIGEEMARQAGK